MSEKNQLSPIQFCRLITFAIIARDMLEWILSFAFVGEKCAARAWRLVYGESSQSTSPPLIITEKGVRLTISRRHSSRENISFDSWKLKVYFELKLWGIFTAWLRSRWIPRCVVVIILIRKSHNHVYVGFWTVAMDSKEFRKRGTEMVEYICQYLETLEDRRVTPSVEPGYLRNLIPGEAPMKPEPWEQIMEDVETKIMPGVTHWQHPRFHAYFPSGNSFPSILGDMLGDAIGCIGFSWVRPA